MRDDDEQKLDPETLSAYERLERLMYQGTPLNKDGDPAPGYEVIEEPIPWCYAYPHPDSAPRNPLNDALKPMQLSATDEQCLQAEATLRGYHADSFIVSVDPAAPDLHFNVFRKEWIEEAIKKGQEALERGELHVDCKDPNCQRPHFVVIDEAVEMTEEDLEKAQAYFKQWPHWPIRPRVEGTAAPSPHIIPVAPLEHLEMDIQEGPAGPQKLLSTQAWLGIEKQATEGRLIPPLAGESLLDIWQRWFPEHTDADGFYHVGPPQQQEMQEPEPEQWWQEAMRYLQQRIVTILGIPEDYVTEVHKSDLDALAYELREKIEDYYG